MKPIVFFVYNGKPHEANLLAGTYRELVGADVEHRQFVLSSQGIPWTNWGSAVGQANPVQNVNAFGRKVV